MSNCFRLRLAGDVIGGGWTGVATVVVVVAVAVVDMDDVDAEVFVVD